jgi:diguanylate cyclase (GGDEF)-like protein
MFEIVEKVSQDQLKGFTEYYRRTVDPEFEVKAFGYETDRRWQPVKDTAYHMPIVFMEPCPPESRKVLGLDISSNGVFMRALEESVRLKRSIASDLFKLVEGDLAYLVHRPIPASDKGGSAQVGNSGAQGGLVMLVILADTLLDRGGHLLPGMRELLYNPSFSSTDPKGRLHLHEGLEASWLKSRLFPPLSVNKVLDSKSQPFVLLVEQQLDWRIISWGSLGLTLLIAVITFGVVMVYARLYYQNEMERAETTVRLFHLANHDALTGLANRTLLADRLNHAISQTARQQGQLAVLFLDLEDFKDVNDTYGHDAGDGVLKRAAERLQACVRAGDTIARLGGDEFVLVLENVAGQQDVDQVVEKIKTGFEQPFDVNAHSIILGINIGCAIYPGDGTDMDALISYADSRMYQDKRSGV